MMFSNETNELQLYATAWVNFINIILHERSQTKKHILLYKVKKKCKLIYGADVRIMATFGVEEE